ncbi:MAG: FAD-binding oxidoreductase [Gammaproteobacteria bacterium]|nr:FAD-binding oxidoreductase [Gammaproteobacteria bacterium]
MKLHRSLSLPRNAGFALFLAIQIGTVAADTIVNDVTQLNPIAVENIIAPTTLEQLIDAVRTHAGPISIGGGRYSMGGQTATERALQIDMRQFDKVVRFSKEKKEITVQAGITWRKIQEYIDPYDLSLQIMQTYANFTVGGSLSVNVHGRYIGQGPLVLSVKSIRVVLADGTIVDASSTKNRHIFYGAIGGYGALGVVAEATLALTDNIKVERQSVVMPLGDYREHFFCKVRDNPNYIFHNADIYPDDYQTVRVTSYLKTDKPVTIPNRLMPADLSYWRDRLAFSVISEWPFGKDIRQHIIDPLIYSDDRVEWRNYEASYNVAELEPRSRAASTYVLQEYFVPVDKIEQFVPRMAQTLNRHKVNVINVSIRYAKQDPGTLLAWARGEVFAFVLYYKQGMSEPERKAVGVWTRELIDTVTALGGAYYLPYQIHATPQQFRAAYPNADKFFALKRKLDPNYKFRNKLWDAYYTPGLPKVASIAAVDPTVDIQARIHDELQHFTGYQRDEAQTYLTLPEWFLVYSPAEYAESLKHKPPTEFPYFGSIGQFWGYYRDAYRVTRNKYGFNWGYHIMVFVIGSSYTIENAIKGAYENTIGRLSEWTASDTMTPEDRYAAQVAQEYVDFIRVDPWYEFSFATRLRKLWAEIDLFGPNLMRKWERKIILSIEYAAKAQYAMLIKLGTKTAYGDADNEMLALATHVSPTIAKQDPAVNVLRRYDDGSMLLALPRYEAFRDQTLRLVKQGVQFREIAGNDEILLTAVVPTTWTYRLPTGKVLFERPILTSDHQQKRVAIEAPVESLHDILRQLDNSGIVVEHLYDY